jgi:H+/Cl- antiporter ClcA
MTCAISADVISRLVFGNRAVLAFPVLPVLPLPFFPLLVLLGVLLGAGGALFNVCILSSQRAYARVPEKYRLFLAFGASALVGCFLPQALGGGHSIIVSLVAPGQQMIPLLVLLAVRFVFTMVCFGSGAPGGIFLPLLAVGALCGGIFGLGVTGLTGLDSAYLATFVALAMAGYFAAVVRAPVTGILLITEMTGSFSQLLSLALVVLCAYLVAEALHSKPIYESLLERMLHARPESQSSQQGKVLLEEVIHLGSALDGRQISDIPWPKGCLVIAVHRGSQDILPRGDTMLQSGDLLILLTDAQQAAMGKRKIRRLATGQQ